MATGSYCEGFSEMYLRTTLNLQLAQRLVMTPKLQQAIKILQMPRLELAQYVSQQMVENPVLEEVPYDESEDEAENGEAEDETSDLEEDETVEIDIDLETGLPDTEVASKSDTPEMDVTDDDFGDFNWEEYFANEAPIARSDWEAPPDDDMRDALATVTPPESLAEHLLWQLRMSVTSEDDYVIGEAIIGSMDRDGYLVTEVIDENGNATGKTEMVDIADIAELLECDVVEVERVLQSIQSFEPTGVGARDLKECLSIQLRQLGAEDTIEYELVEKGHLQDLQANRLPQIAKSLGVDLEMVRQAASAIALLEPYPGCQFNSTKPEYAIPDVTVKEIEGEYRIFMNDSGPSIGLNPYYGRLSSQGSLQSEDREYIRKKIESARWLMESIERRRRTVLRVTESIFEVQRGFLDEGPTHLKPLTLRDISDDLGISESTVSRVTRNRYVQTPRGVFELKYFFNSALSTKSGGVASSLSVKEIIKSMINEEDPQKPLSDNDIELQLGHKGVNIARRTIAKYRGELNIPSSTKRKKW